MPPYDTGVDRAPRWTPLHVQYDGSGEPIMDPVGSHAIRALIAERPADHRAARPHPRRTGPLPDRATTGFNPGSQYQDGVLQGLLLRVSARHGLRDSRSPPDDGVGPDPVEEARRIVEAAEAAGLPLRASAASGSPCRPTSAGFAATDLPRHRPRAPSGAAGDRPG